MSASTSTTLPTNQQSSSEENHQNELRIFWIDELFKKTIAKFSKSSARERVTDARSSDELPSYDDFIQRADNSPPPTYESMIAQRSFGASRKTFLFFFFMSIVVIFALASIALAIIGIVFRYKCPVKEIVPIWLIIFGLNNLFGIISGFVILIFELKKKTPSRYISKPILAVIYTPICTFMAIFIIWLLYGTFVILFAFSIDRNNCNPVVYATASWSIIAMWILISLSGALSPFICYRCKKCRKTNGNELSNTLNQTT